MTYCPHCTGKQAELVSVIDGKMLLKREGVLSVYKCHDCGAVIYVLTPDAAEETPDHERTEN